MTPTYQKRIEVLVVVSITVRLRDSASLNVSRVLKECGYPVVPRIGDTLSFRPRLQRLSEVVDPVSYEVNAYGLVTTVDEVRFIEGMLPQIWCSDGHCLGGLRGSSDDEVKQLLSLHAAEVACEWAEHGFSLHKLERGKLSSG